MANPILPSTPNTRTIAYRWKRIEPISVSDKELDVSDLQQLQESWGLFKARLNTSNPDTLRRFNDRLIRSLSIETGILERIYDLDRGTTEALITKGFIEDLIGRESTNIEPSTLVDILHDQQAAVLLVQELVANTRKLTKGVLYELHAILTRNQQTVAAVDQFGARVTIPFRRGAFKELPNNPNRPDGSIHEYCPPEHVDSEIETLLGMLGSYERDHPILVSAWLHHRFTQIHPFQDGNGRVARAITTYALLRGGYLPLVIDRDRRTDYLSALWAADQGDLSYLVKLLGGLEKNAILQALSLDPEAEAEAELTITSAVIASIAAKFSKRREAKRQDFLRVNEAALELRHLASQIAREKFQELVNRVFTASERPGVFIEEGGPDHSNSHWYKFEILQGFEPQKKWINFDNGHYFVKASVRYEDLRLVFVLSIHHIGRELTGVMEATSFANLEAYDQTAENGEERFEKQSLAVSVEPFTVTWNSNVDRLKSPFSRWLDTSIAVAFKEWGDRT